MSKLNKLTKQAQAHMEPGETVLASVLGAYETKMLGNKTVRNGILMATDQRVLFYAKKFGGYDLESFPYPNISSFELSKGMMGHKIKMFASGNEVEVKWINKGDLDLLLQEVKRHMKGGAPSHAAEEVGAAEVSVKTSPADQLREFASLRDEGIITEEEFEAKKRQILGL